MPRFSESDIDAAKRRVQEMHERASRYTDNSQTKRQGSESHSNTYENKPKDIEKRTRSFLTVMITTSPRISLFL